jgi:hypothetical protein
MRPFELPLVTSARFGEAERALVTADKLLVGFLPAA